MHKKNSFTQINSSQARLGIRFRTLRTTFPNSNCLCTKTSFTPSHSSQACSGTGTELHDTYITLITYAQNLIPLRRGSGTGTRFHDTSLTLCLIGDFEKKRSYYDRVLSRPFVCPSIRQSIRP